MKTLKFNKLMAFAFVATLLFALPFVLAEDQVITDNATSDSAEIITTSADLSSVDSSTVAEINDSLDGSVSGLRVGWENAKLWFTFNNEKKAEQELKIARLRLIQAKVAAQSGNTEAMQRALDAHDELINRVKLRVESLDGETSGQGIRSSAEKLVGLARAIEVHEARISKLNEILASANLTNEQRAKVEERLSKVEENTDKLREVQAEKRDKLKERLSKVANLTDDEAESEIENIEDSQNLSIIRQLIAEKRAEHAEKIREKLEERIQKAQERIQEAREKAEERIAKELDDDSEDNSRSNSGSDDSEDDSDSDSDDSEDDSGRDSNSSSSNDSN